MTSRSPQHESFWVLGEHLEFKATGKQTNGAFALVELTAFPRNGPPPHIHQREDESFYVLEGEFSVLFGQEWRQVTAGSFVLVPKSTVHTYQNNTEARARALVLLTPAGFEGFWREIGQPAVDDIRPPAPSPEVLSRLPQIAARYGLELVTANT